MKKNIYYVIVFSMFLASYFHAQENKNTIHSTNSLNKKINTNCSDTAAIQKIIKQASDLASKRSFEEAELLLKNLIDQCKESKHAITLLALILSWDKKYDESINMYHNLLKLEPDSVVYHLEIGRVFLWYANDSKDTRYVYSAVKEFTSFLNKYPSDCYALKQIGIAYQKIGQIDSAYSAFLSATKSMPSDKEANKLLLEAIAAKNKSKIPESNTFSEQVLNSIAEAHELGKQRKFFEAERILSDILLADNNNIYAASELARILKWDKKYNQSVDIYKKILLRQPGNIGLHLEIAETLLFQADESKINSYRYAAIKEYESFLKFCPADCFSLKQIGAAYLRLGQIDSAYIKLRLANNSCPDDEEAGRLLAETLSAQKEYEKAAILISKYIQGNPNYPELRLLYADYLIKSGDLFGAEKEFRTVIEKYPGDVPSISGLGRVLLWQNKFDEAKYYLQIAVLKKKDAQSYIDLGDIESKREHWKAAIEYYKIVLDMEPQNETAKKRIYYAESMMKPWLDFKYTNFNSSTGLNNESMGSNLEIDFLRLGTWNIGYQKLKFFEEGTPKIFRNDYQIVWNLSPADWLKTDLGYNFSDYQNVSSNKKQSSGWLASVSIIPTSKIKFNITYSRSPLSESFATLDPEYYSDKINISVEAKIFKDLTLLASSYLANYHGTYSLGYWNPTKDKWVVLKVLKDESKHQYVNGQIIYNLSYDPTLLFRVGMSNNLSTQTQDVLPYWSPAKFLQEYAAFNFSGQLSNHILLEGELSGMHIHEGSGWGYKGSVYLTIRLARYLDINSVISYCSVGTEVPWNGRVIGTALRLRYP